VIAKSRHYVLPYGDYFSPFREARFLPALNGGGFRAKISMKSTTLSSVYVSYRHEVKSKAIVECLKKACESRGITLTVDDRALGYRDSIRDFMRQLGAGGCIVVVLSEDYLKSKNCMFELLEIEKNRDIRDRVFPIILRGTKIHDAEDRLTFIKYWEEKSTVLEAELKQTKSQAYLPSIHKDLDLYSDIRRAIDGLMDLLGDMYCLDENVHSETNFETLLDAIQARLAPPAGERFDPRVRERVERIWEQVVAGIEAELGKPGAESLQAALAQQLAKYSIDQGAVAGPAATARRLCNLDVEDALRLLHIAVHTALKAISSASQVIAVREAARNILGWLLLFSVKDKWVLEREGRGVGEDGDLELKIPVETEAGTEILVARLSGSPASFESDEALTRVFGRRHATGGMPIPEVGWGAVDTVVEIKRAIWKALNKQSVDGPWTPQHDERLDYVLQLRRDVDEGHYVTVRSFDLKDPLRHEEVFKNLRRTLPHLQVVFLEGGQGDEVLVVVEWKLATLIREFLRTLREGRNA
jgi:hypothetical protein